MPGHAKADAEGEMVTRLIQAMEALGTPADPISIINIYVALKSKPLAVLVGPSHSGKIALVSSLAQVLTDGDSLHGRVLPGHAWWAGRSAPTAFFTEAQTRFNADKILALMEEAWQAENADRLFVVCLARISPAELTGFFSEVAFQLQHGEIMRLPSLHLSEPMPYPPNLRLMGTMDAACFKWPDEDLLSMTTVIPWGRGRDSVDPPRDQPPPAVVKPSWRLNAGIGTETAARLKLRRYVMWPSQALQPILQIQDLLRRHAIVLPQAITRDALIYLANAWSKAGAGLFDPAPPRNLLIALDWVILQTVLERLSEALQASIELRRQLADMLWGLFPRSVAFLDSLG